MLFAQRQNSPHELGQNPVANGIGEYPHWVHESLVFTKPCFFCISKTSRPFLPRRNHLPNGHGCQSEHFPLRRSSRSHPPMRHASLAASSIAGHLWLPGVMFHAHQGASGLGNTMKAVNDACQLSNTIQVRKNWRFGLPEQSIKISSFNQKTRPCPQLQTTNPNHQFYLTWTINEKIV